ncbi:MAG: hypothetical protein ACXWG0_01790 [Chthoniobacterales bacterium]
MECDAPFFRDVVIAGFEQDLNSDYDFLSRAIRIINAPWGLGIGARHITVSTSGLAPQIRELANESAAIRRNEDRQTRSPVPSEPNGESGNRTTPSNESPGRFPASGQC